MNQRPIEVVTKEFITEQAKIHFGLDVSKTEVYMKSEDFVKFMTLIAHNERRQADERLREVVGEILKQLWQIYTVEGGMVTAVLERDIKAIAQKHNIDITPNTPQV